MLSTKLLAETRRLWWFSAFALLVIQLKKTTQRLITKRGNVCDRFMGVVIQEFKLVDGKCIGANLGSLPVILRVSLILYQFYPFQGILCSRIEFTIKLC